MKNKTCKFAKARALLDLNAGMQAVVGHPTSVLDARLLSRSVRSDEKSLEEKRAHGTSCWKIACTAPLPGPSLWRRVAHSEFVGGEAKFFWSFGAYHNACK